MTIQNRGATGNTRTDSQLQWRLRPARFWAYGSFAALTVLAVARGHPQWLASIAATYLVAAPLIWHELLLRQLAHRERSGRRRGDGDASSAPDDRIVLLAELAITGVVVAATLPVALAACACAGLLLVRIATEGARRLALCVGVTSAVLVGGVAIGLPAQSVAGADLLVLGATTAWFVLLASAVSWLGFDARRALANAHRRGRVGYRALARLAYRLGRYMAPELRHVLQDEEGIAARELDIDRLFDASAVRRPPIRSWLSVCFVDITGFTGLTERAEPEEVATVLDVYQREMASLATAHGGTVDKFMGDGVLVLFGNLGDGSRQAIAADCLRMALAMQGNLPQLNARLAAFGVGAPLRLRWGIASGTCTVGDFGSDERLHYTALGRVVNLASRLEALAEPDTIRVCERTACVVGGEFVFDKRRSLAVPGLPEAVVTSELVAERESAVAIAPRRIAR